MAVCTGTKASGEGMVAIFAVNACWFVRVVAKGSVEVRSPFFLIIFECYCNYLHVANAHKKTAR